MANHVIHLFSLHTNRGSGFNAGYLVQTEWNDVSETQEVWLFSSFFDVSPTQKFTGPSLGLLHTDWEITGNGHQFCDGTTLNYFNYNAGTFPYSIRARQFDSIACYQAPVCDLVIANSPTIVAATSAGSNNGSVTATATSSNGIIKWALFDFDYATQGQTTGAFLTQYAGTYTIWAKDALGCSATISVTIPITLTYAIRWVSEWKGLPPGPLKNHKVEILERGYAGASESIVAGGIAANYKINADGDNSLDQVRASEFTFKAYDLTNFKFSDLYGEDERQFILKYYRDDGSGYVLRWIGYVNPYLYNEPYRSTPYQVQITATDGLGSLRDFDFVDESNNIFISSGTILSFICQMLKKLDLDINLRISVNVYEATIASTASDDPLAQVKINPALYYGTDDEPKDCLESIKNLLREFGACICQADAKWIIFRPEETRANFDYREYNLNAVYQSNGTISPLANLDAPTTSNRVAWREESGMMTMIPSYGKFIIKQILKHKKSLLQSYSFEEKDIVPFSPTSEFFAGWGISINSGTGITWGFQDVDRDTSKGALYIQFSPGSYKEVILYSLTAPIQYKGGDQIKISWDYLISLTQQFSWYTFKYKLKIGSYYLFVEDDNVGFTAVDPGYIEVHTESFNDWKTFDTVVGTPGEANLTEGLIEFTMLIHNGATPTGYDKSDLDAEVTTGSTAVGMRRVANISVGSTTIRGFYELDTVSTGAAEVIPDLIIPTDFSAVYPKGFKLRGSNNGLINVTSILIDNVVIEYMPGGQASPAFQETEVTVNTNNKRTLQVDIVHGDCPTNIVNAKNTYNSFFTFNNAPTGVWTRDGVSESELIQRVLIKTLIAQYQKFGRRLQGTLVSDIHLYPYTTLVEVLDNNKLYQVQAFDVSLTNNDHTVDLYQLKNISVVDDGGTSSFSGAFDPLAFSMGFD